MEMARILFAMVPLAHRWKMRPALGPKVMMSPSTLSEGNDS